MSLTDRITIPARDLAPGDILHIEGADGAHPALTMCVVLYADPIDDGDGVDVCFDQDDQTLANRSFRADAVLEVTRGETTLIGYSSGFPVYRPTPAYRRHADEAAEAARTPRRNA